MKISRNSSQNGVTLIELMVVVAVSSVVMAGMYLFYQTNLRSHITQQAVVDMQQDMRAAAYMLAREIRSAGYDPRETTGATIITARIAEIQFQLDENEDGDFVDETLGNDPNEQIRYLLSNDDGDGMADGTPCNLSREVWNDGLQDVALNIDALNFVYLDADGNDLMDYGAFPPAVPADELENIRTVQITIVGRSGQELPYLFNSGADTGSFTNQQGQVILGTPIDEFRRIRLTTEIRVRNMGL
jgi:type IV pilus assembly protein PilW